MISVCKFVCACLSLCVCSSVCPCRILWHSQSVTRQWSVACGRTVAGQCRRNTITVANNHADFRTDVHQLADRQTQRQPDGRTDGRIGTRNVARMSVWRQFDNRWTTIPFSFSSSDRQSVTVRQFEWPSARVFRLPASSTSKNPDRQSVPSVRQIRPINSK